MPFPWIAVALAGSTIIDALLSNKKYPPEIEKLLKSLGIKANDLINSEGYTQDEINALFGKEYENVRTQGKNVRDATTGILSRAGMLGTGTEAAMGQKNAWENENLVTNAMRDMVIAKGAKKSQDQALATQMAQTAVGADVSRVEKGPQLTELVALLGMMGIGTGAEGGAAKLTTNKINPVADSLAFLGGRGFTQTPAVTYLNESLFGQRNDILSNDLFGGGFDYWLKNIGGGLGIQNTSKYWPGLVNKPTVRG